MSESNRHPVIEQVTDAYNAIADHFSQTRSGQWEAVRFAIEQYISPADTVLDLGCGNGRVADLVQKIKANYIGMDISEGLIAHAKRLHPGLPFYVGNMLDTGFENASMDHVLLIASFHHLPAEERRAGLEEIKRITKPGGTIIMTNWNLHQSRFFWLRWKHALRNIGDSNMHRNDVLVPWRNQQRELQAERFYHGFTMREMKQLAQRAGLDMIDQYYELHGMHVPKRKGQNLVTILRVPA